MQYAAATTLLYLPVPQPEWEHHVDGMHRDFKLPSNFNSIFCTVDDDTAFFKGSVVWSKKFGILY